MCSSDVTPLDALLAAVARFGNSVERVTPPAEALPEMLQGLRRACNALELDFARLAAAFAEGGQWDAEGYVSPHAWLRDRCNMTGGAIASALQVGERAPDLERSVAALEDGRIGFAHLALLARTAEAVSDAGASFDEEGLLGRAEHLTPWHFQRDCAHARHAADAEAFLEAQRREVDHRYLQIRSVGDEGCMSLRGFLDPEGGLAVRTALESLGRSTGVGDQRDRPRRLADALVEACVHLLDNDGLGGGRHVPHLQVTTTLETLMGVSGSPGGELGGAGAPAGAGCAVPVAEATVARYACAANVRRVLLGPDSAVVDVGRERRLPAPATRRQVEHRDQGCVWPGCDRPVSWTQPHHVRHWARGGDSQAANLVSLCHRHHALAHDGGWQVVRVEGQREVMVIPPIPLGLPPVRGPGATGAA